MSSKIIITCHHKDCTNSRKITWKGKFIEKWYCREHKDGNKIKEEVSLL